MSNKKMTRTHCKRDHELAVVGFWWSKDGSGGLFRQCRECAKLRKRKWYATHTDRLRAENYQRTLRRRERTGVVRISRQERARNQLTNEAT